jgi:hypothetical protein
VRATRISPGAKLVYGRLVRYAGQDGDCHPAVPTLAGETGISVRQTQYYLVELERNKLIRRETRLSKSGQTSNADVFLWHPLFQAGVKKAAPKEGPSEESHFEESHNSDLDSPSANRKNRDSRPDVGAGEPACKQYPRVREALAEYMITADDPECVSPPDRLVVDVMDAAAGASEDKVIRCLRYLREERRLLPGTKHGPRHFQLVQDGRRRLLSAETVPRDGFFAAPTTDAGADAAVRFPSVVFHQMAV